MDTTAYNHTYGPLDRVISEQGSVVSKINSAGVLAAIFKKRTSPPITVGIFQGAQYSKDIGQVSQQLVCSLTKQEDSLPAHLICLLYDHINLNENDFRKIMPMDVLDRIKISPFCSPPNFQQKPESSIDAHFAYEITNESSPEVHQKRLQQEARQLSSLNDKYGLTRTEALYNCAVNDALKRISTQYQGAPLHAREFNLFFTQFLPAEPGLTDIKTNLP